MNATAQPLVVTAVIAGSWLMMILSGTQKRAHDWKRQRRRCPSCGRDSRDCSCRS